MSPDEIKAMLRQVKSGKLSVEAAVDRLRNLPFEDIGYARIDHHRSLRQGFPEVIFARGKSPDHVVGIVQGMLRNQHNILITRGDEELFELLKPLDKRTRFHALSGAISIRRDRKIRGKGKILVVSAGTSDIPVAEEAQVT
ncbi:MAG TPA: 1-(5-phosphoribosyl)-5-amino-4-imidazole-carboxylate carboxylase, partial [Terriglobia bacterium]|nr:1-(5-phosphoribosyl)-5-amino-4-imidazole-carboxylate carboxylase [Terriglobia bacterium]